MARARIIFLLCGTQNRGYLGLLTPNFGNWYKAATQRRRTWEHDFKEIAAEIRELAWSDGKRVTRSWVETEEEEIP